MATAAPAPGTSPQDINAAYLACAQVQQDYLNQDIATAQVKAQQVGGSCSSDDQAQIAAIDPTKDLATVGNATSRTAAKRLRRAHRMHKGGYHRVCDDDSDGKIAAKVAIPAQKGGPGTTGVCDDGDDDDDSGGKVLALAAGRTAIAVQAQKGGPGTPRVCDEDSDGGSDGDPDGSVGIPIVPTPAQPPAAA